MILECKNFLALTEFYGLAYAGIGKVVGDAFPIRLVREPFPDLGQMVLTISIVNVG